MNLQVKLNLESRAASGGRVKLTARLNGETIAFETLDPGDALARTRFAEKLHKKISAASVEDIELALSKLVDLPRSTKFTRRRVLENWTPFPTECLAPTVRRFVEEGAAAVVCDPSYFALPLLTTLAASIGDTRRLELKLGWSVPAILWTALVGESGTAKTPAFSIVMRPFRKLQAKAFERFKREEQQFVQSFAVYEKDFNEWKRKRGATEPPPDKPPPPAAERLLVSDTTVEALAPLLLENPRGLLLACDELAGWIGSFDRYSSGKGGADVPLWLSMFNAEAITVDRKTGIPRTIHVPTALVCVTGGIQPGILRRALTSERRESGFAARLLLACPPRIAKQWTEAGISPALEEELLRMVERLRSIQADTSGDGTRRPHLVPLSSESKRLWVEYVNSHNLEQATLSGDLAAAYSKLEEYPARFALVDQFARWAGSDPLTAPPEEIEAESMQTGITLANWFKAETRRIYSMLSETEDQQRDRELVEWIARKGGTVTARQLQQGRANLKSSEEAEAALQRLTEADFGEWLPSERNRRGGRPTHYFRLYDASTIYETPTNQAQTRGSVDVDTSK